MIRFIEQRGTGKTYRLLRMAEMNEGIFVCGSPNTMKRFAESHKIDAEKIQFMRYSQLLDGTLHGNRKPVYIDELEFFLQHIHPYIEGYNFSLEDFNWWEEDNEDN